MEEPGLENPLRQVIVATHSPAFVQLQDRDDLLVTTETLVRQSEPGIVRTLRCHPLSGTWRAAAGESPVGLGTLLAYLTAPPGAQLELPQLAA